MRLCKALRRLLLQLAPSAHAALMFTWKGHQTKPTRNIVPEELARPQGKVIANSDLPRLKLVSDSRHSHSRLHGVQLPGSREQRDALLQRGAHTDGQPQSLHAVSPASQLVHRRQHGGKHQSAAVRERPPAQNRMQRPAQPAAQLLPQRHGHRQRHRWQQVPPRHHGTLQLTLQHRPPCWSSQLLMGKLDVHRARSKREVNRAAKFSRTHVEREDCLRTRGEGA